MDKNNYYQYYWILNTQCLLSKKKTHFGQEDNNGLMDMNILLDLMDTEYLMFTQW